MDFTKYRRLKKLVLSGLSFDGFIGEVARWPRRYAVLTPKNWTKADYQWFYEKIKGGHNYASLVKESAAA